MGSKFAAVPGSREYRRLQREDTARRAGRSIAPYIPQAERIFLARLLKAELSADRRRREFQRSELQRLTELAAEVYGSEYQRDPVLREQVKRKQRTLYEKYQDAARCKVARYKANHPIPVAGQHLRRRERIEETSDGTLTTLAVRRLKADARACAYCNLSLYTRAQKKLSHLIPLALGGEHSERNTVVACIGCVGRKGWLTYAQWLERAGSAHKDRIIALWIERYGSQNAGEPPTLKGTSSDRLASGYFDGIVSVVAGLVGSGQGWG